MSDNNKPDLIAYQVVEVNGKKRWNAIGVAWANSKGGFNARLNAIPIPVTGEIVFLPPKEKEEQQ